MALIPAAEQPSAAEAFEEVKDRARSVSSIDKKTMGGAAQVAKDKLHRDRSPNEDPALGPGESMEALGSGDPTDVTGPDLLEAAGLLADHPAIDSTAGPTSKRYGVEADRLVAARARAGSGTPLSEIVSSSR